MSSSPLHIVCPSCHKTNRVPADRLGQQPKCGHCQQAIFAGKPLALGLQNIDQHLSRNDIPLLIDFWAPWCGPCQTMSPAFAQAAFQLEPRFRLIKIDTENEPTLGSRFAIRSIPTLLLMHRGKEIARQSGAVSAGQIVQWAEQALAKAK